MSLCFTTHNPTNGAETKVLLAEANIITLFPKTTGNRALKYLLDSYLGMDKSQIAKLKKLKSRAVSVIRGYPQDFHIVLPLAILKTFLISFHCKSNSRLLIPR